MLCTWSRDHGIRGVGVDISEVFLAAAESRAAELAVTDRVRFIHADASTYRHDTGPYDVVSCIGATWIGGGLAGTIDLIRPLVHPDGLVLIGEPYWISEPSREAREAEKDTFASLAGALDQFEDRGVELLEMVLADGDSWDRFEAAKWWTITQWLDDHPGHPDHSGLREFLDTGRRNFLTYRKQYLGWGVFVLRPRRTAE
jgi:hypothetical protein